MELQSRPEALAVELARHQNGDLKKQLHERQPRIAALSDKQEFPDFAGDTRQASILQM